jgi:hypothetical protein
VGLGLGHGALRGQPSAPGRGRSDLRWAVPGLAAPPARSRVAPARGPRAPSAPGRAAAVGGRRVRPQPALHPRRPRAVLHRERRRQPRRDPRHPGRRRSPVGARRRGPRSPRHLRPRARRRDRLRADPVLPRRLRVSGSDAVRSPRSPDHPAHLRGARPRSGGVARRRLDRVLEERARHLGAVGHGPALAVRAPPAVGRAGALRPGLPAGLVPRRHPPGLGGVAGRAAIATSWSSTSPPARVTAVTDDRALEDNPRWTPDGPPPPVHERSHRHRQRLRPRPGRRPGCGR